MGYVGEMVYLETVSWAANVYIAKADAMNIMQSQYFSAVKELMGTLGFDLVWQEEKSINSSGVTTLQDVYMLEGVEKYVSFIYSQNIDSSALVFYISIDDELTILGADVFPGNSTKYVGNISAGYSVQTTGLGDGNYEVVTKMRSPMYFNVVTGKSIQLISMTNASKDKGYSDNWFGTATINGERSLIAKRSGEIDVYGGINAKLNYNMLAGLNMQGDGKIAVMPVFLSNGCTENDVIMEEAIVDGCLQNAGKKVAKGSFVLVDGAEYIAVGADGRWLVEL